VVPEPAAASRLFGHGEAEETFARLASSGRHAHAWMLTGPRGVGKATLAFRFARLLLAGPETGPACHEPAHPVFRMVAQGAHPDLQVLKREPDPRTKRMRGEIVIEQVRHAAEQLRSTAALGGARVLVIDAADELNRATANALLKLLEEPPAGVVMFLVVQRPGRLPRTIASRCAVLRLQPLDPQAMAEGLRHLAPDLDRDRLQRIGAAAGGSLGRALELSNAEWLRDYERLLAALASDSQSLGDRIGAAELLAGRCQPAGPEAAADPLFMLLRRAAQIASGGELQGELVEGESALLRGLAGRLTLDRLLALWEKLATLVGRIDALNLDPLQSFLQIVEAAADRGTELAFAER
jgi:DNA polymerase III subunit delta'